MPDAKFPKALFFVIVLALALRGLLLLVAFQHPGRAFQPDSSTYVDPALGLISSGSYPPENASRTPVYPMFIALVYSIASQNPAFITLVQVLIGTASVFLTYRLGLQLLNQRIALIGALLMAISLESITHSFYILTETLFTFFLLTSLLAWVKAWKESNRLWLVISAILMGLGVLCRPIGLYFAVLMAVVMLFRLREHWLTRLRDAILFLLVVAAVLFPWIYRNEVVIGVPTISTISNYNLLAYNATSLEANLQGTGEAQVRPELLARADQRLASAGLENSEANRARVQSRLALQIILAHPFRYMYLHLKSDLNNLLPDVTSLTEILGLTTGGKGTLSVLNQSGLLAAVNHYFGGSTWLLLVFLPAILVLGLVYAMDVIGFLALLKERAWFVLALLILPGAYFLLIPGATSLPRFRVPVMPYLCLLAGLGIDLTRNFLKKKSLSRNSKP